MGSTFSVSTGTLTSGSGTVTAVSADVEASVASMMSILVALQDEWTGAASASFQELVADWRTTQQVVKNSLDDIGRALAQAGEAYDAAEASVQAAFAGR